MRRVFSALLTTTALSLAGSAMVIDAAAQPPAPSSPNAAVPVAPPEGQTRGVAVLGLAGARDDAFALARAVYASRLRPQGLDEIRARVLAGDPPPPNATRSLIELAEVRAATKGEDAASRRLLAGIGKQVGAAAVLVVSRTEGEAPPADDAGATNADASAVGTRVTARLFLVDAGEFDAARYEPDGTDAPWRATVASLEQRFPKEVASVAGPTHPATQPVPPKESEGKPFYSSPWFWGALGAAVVVGGAFYLASRDTDSGTIHLQMRSPPR